MTWSITMSGSGSNADSDKRAPDIAREAVALLQANGLVVSTATMSDNSGSHNLLKAAEEKTDGEG